MPLFNCGGTLENTKNNAFIFILIIILVCCKNLTTSFSVTREGKFKNTGLELAKLFFSICEAKVYLSKIFTDPFCNFKFSIIYIIDIQFQSLFF